MLAPRSRNRQAKRLAAIPMKSEIDSLLFGHLSIIFGFCLGFWLVARVLRQHYRPSVSIAWLLSILFIPYLGVPAYFLFGGRKIARRRGKKKGLYSKSGSNSPRFEGMDPLECILSVAHMPPQRPAGRFEFIPDGEKAYATLRDLIAQAEHSIHVMTFILGRDEVGKAIVAQLAAKAESGVKVRLLLDALGCLTTRGRFVSALRRAGGRVGVFAPVLPVRRKWSANLRNHRKMVIVDGKKALIGGMNLAREYMGPNPDPQRWLDSAIFLEGPAVLDLEEVFTSDWNFAAKEALRSEPIGFAPPVSGQAGPSVQIAASGPDVAEDPVHDAILTACMGAHKRIWIVTPYFIPDEGIARALLLQARLGRDVRILLPRRSNHFFADLARGPCLRQMRASGAKIYLYGGGMVHAKHLIVDEDLTLAGSMNLDMRSLYLNYEVGVFIRSREDVGAVAAWAQALMERSVAFRQTRVGKVQGFLEDVSMLISPLL